MILYTIAALITFAVIVIASLVIFCKKTGKKTIAGKHVVVIGGSSGIGKSFAILAAKKGAKVTIIARTLEKLQKAVVEIDNGQFVQLDVSNFDTTKSALIKLDDELPIDMLVNCAGKAICGIVEDLTVDNVKEMFNINYFGTLYPIQVLIERFKKRRNCIIVLTSSQAGLLGIFGYSVYSSTKYALRGLAEALSMELSPYDCSVTLALPPDTDTPGYEIENMTKPEETQLISESGGLFQSDVVASQMLEDAMKGNFFSHVGFESFILTTLCAGMSPVNSFFDFICQCSLMGVIRLISVGYLHQFNSIIQKCSKKRVLLLKQN